MHRKVLAVLFVLFTSVFFAFAESDEEWYWNQPISKIEFNGLKNVKKSELVGVTSSYIDDPFSDEIYNEILDRLYELDLFEDIVPYAKHDPKNDDKVLLVFEVVERPVLSAINFVGNKKIRNGELREQIKIKTSDVFVESKVLIDERTIRNYYLSKGYMASSVSHKIEENDNGIAITFLINEGSSTVIKEISFIGNTIASSRTLKNKIELKELSLFKDGAYQPSTLEQDKITLINYYKEHGYADVNIVDVKIDSNFNTDKQRNELTITFVIQEGAQYTYGGLRLTGNEVFTEQELLKQHKLRVGSIYNETKFQEDLRAVVSIYYENGYMSNEFYPVPLKDTDRHELSYDLTIREHSRSHIENVIIKGNNKTKEYVIRREIPIEPGDIYSKDKIENGLRNLMNLRYFSNIIPEPQQGTEENLVDLVVNVEETTTTNFNFGAIFSGITDPNTIPISLFLKFENSNLWGEGKSVSASTTISNTEQSIDFSYSQNWIKSLPVTLSEQLSFKHAIQTSPYNFWTPGLDLNQKYYYMEYQNYSATLSSALSRRWTPDYAIISVAGGIANSILNNIYDEKVYVPTDNNISVNANRVGLSNSLFASVSVDNRDVYYDPSKGWFASERLSWFGLIPNVEKEFYLKSDTKLEGYFKLFDIPVSESWSFKMVLAGYSGLSMQIPVGSSVSDASKLYIDGMFNGRGWSNIYKKTKGMVLFSNKLELRLPIVPGIVGIDGFWDAVAIKSSVQDLSTLNLNDFYFSFGPAVRLLIPQFPLHLLFAWKYRIIDGVHKFDDEPFQFVLSFNLPNH